MTTITKLLCPTCGKYFIAELGTKAGLICLRCPAQWHTAHPKVLANTGWEDRLGKFGTGSRTDLC